MACGMGLQKLRVHNWSMVNSCIIGAWSIHSCGILSAQLRLHCLARGEEGVSTKGFVVVGVVCGLCRCCIDTRG